MIFPPFSELDADQRKVFAESPTKGALLITGPPGTGKTVVAMHRAFRLGKNGMPVTVFMFNKVLAKYTSNFDSLPANIEITHAHNWARQWYRNAFNKPIPKIDRFTFDWNMIASDIRACDSPQVLKRLHWGHLIVDEGQDFPPDMYKCFMRVVRHKGYRDSEPPTLSVFADENQIITENHSSISQIAEELNASITNKRLWRLDKNYRNKKEVAKFARYYQVIGAGSARLPDEEHGIKPSIFVYEESNKEINQIVNVAVGGGEIGVIVFGSKGDVRSTHERIKNRVESKRINCRVQGYISGRDSPLSNVNFLHFDAPPSITVVHSQSAKGLEFDTVFVVNFAALNPYDAGEIDSYKRLYVVASRARSNLFIFLHGSPEHGFPTTTRLLPQPEDQLCEYICVENWSDKLGSMLKDIDWLQSATLYQRKEVKRTGLVDSLLSLGKDKASEIFHEAATRASDFDALKTIIDDRLDWKSNSVITDLIVELGMNNVKSILKMRTAQ